jgi:hypothetical protein
MGVAGQSHFLAIFPRGKSLGIHCSESWVCPRASLDGCGDKKISWPHWNLKPKPIILLQVTILCKLSWPQNIIIIEFNFQYHGSHSNNTAAGSVLAALFHVQPGANINTDGTAKGKIKILLKLFGQ